MKKIFASLLFSLSLLFVFISAQAQTQDFTVDGVHVFLRPSTKDVISVRLFISGGTANYPLDKQGIEDLTLDCAINNGTTSMDKTAFNTAAEKIGAEFGSDASLDYGQMSLSCIKTYWDQSWNLFTDAILNPAFDEKEFGLTQSQMVATAKQRETNPDAYLNQVAMNYVFSGKNYAKIPGGTSESLSKITIDDVKDFYKNDVVKSRCILVVVGDVTRADVEAKVKASFAKLPQGVSSSKEDRVVIRTGDENIVDRDMATNYLSGIFSTAPLQSPDGVPMMLAMNIMSNRYFIELRTKRSLSYAPASFLNTDAINSPYGTVYISTDSPKASIKVMVDIINDIKENGFKEDELADSKNKFLTSYLMNFETSSGQSLALGRWALRGTPEMYDQFVAKTNATTLKDLNRVFDQNSGAIIWTYLGKKTDVTQDDFKQPQVYKNKPY